MTYIISAKTRRTQGVCENGPDRGLTNARLEAWVARPGVALGVGETASGYLRQLRHTAAEDVLELIMRGYERTPRC